jgi:hypothetical protein
MDSEAAAEFRKRAQDCVNLSKTMGPKAKPILLSIAEAWMALAHDAESTPTEMPPNQTAPSTDKIQ